MDFTEQYVMQVEAKTRFNRPEYKIVGKKRNKLC